MYYLNQSRQSVETASVQINKIIMKNFKIFFLNSLDIELNY